MSSISSERHGAIDVVIASGEHDLTTVAQLEGALAAALSDSTTSCLLDLSQASFVDSSVVAVLLRWSKEAQVSEREALAIVVGDADTPISRVLGLVDLLARLPVFATREQAIAALEEGRRPRGERTLGWLSDRELGRAQAAALADSSSAGTPALREAAMLRLGDIVREQQRRRRENGDDASTSTDT